MKKIFIIFILFVNGISFAKEKELKLHDPFKVFYPHLGDSICRIKAYQIDLNLDKGLDNNAKIKAWKKYEKLCSKDGSYQLLLADAYATYKNYPAAKEVLEQAIENAKFDTRYHKSLLHEVYINLNEINKSLELAISLIKEYPGFDSGYRRLAINGCLVKNWMKAKEIIEVAVSLNPHSSPNYRVLTRISYELGEYDKVRLYFNKALDLDPFITFLDRSSTLSVLDVYIIQKDLEAANSMITQLLKIDAKIRDVPRFVELQDKYKHAFIKSSR